MTRAKAAETLESIAHQRLLDDIRSGELPPNSRLKIRDLAARYEIGATPLREALSKLVPEGLVSVEQNKGFRVAPLSLRELIEITEMRQIIEAEAFRRSLERGDDTWESEVVAAFHRLSKSIATYPAGKTNEARLEWEERHRGFHRVLVSACGNSKLIRGVEMLHQNLIRYRSVFLMTEISTDELRFMHQDLMRVALDRDLDAAIPIMRRHVKVNVDQVKDGLNKNPNLEILVEDGDAGLKLHSHRTSD
ncbi:DNA-binding GntR family transcriptional regulator [Rhodoligotrophos appendicifer]|uniref:GntR family transcriptional regulator n=1 Tax=Rhodoligotrophos appendicifer TaxID=987056 RepID=UPI001478344B|nr:GntR family transcriptional regulator [Rhodoligotrophos appendicifer]